MSDLSFSLPNFSFSSSPMRKIHFTSSWLLKKSCLSQKVQKLFECMAHAVGVFWIFVYICFGLLVVNGIECHWAVFY